MFEKINLLALSATGNGLYTREVAAKAAAEAKERTTLILILVAILAVCLLIAVLEPEIKNYLSSRDKNKAEAETKAELDPEELKDVPDEVGVSINDCVKVSRYLSKWLDKEDFIKEVYTLEVCSKGFLDSQNDNEGDMK